MNTLVIFLMAAIRVAVPHSGPASHVLPVFGLAEQVRLYPGEIGVRAKLDTGADNSSLHAEGIYRFKRKGEHWVRFETLDEDGERASIERPVVRMARIKRPMGKVQSRVVITMGICLGSIYREVEVTLVDRRRFRFPMVLGRSFMEGVLMVDPALSATSKPKCPNVP